MVVDYYHRYHFSEIALPPLSEHLVFINLGGLVNLTQQRNGRVYRSHQSRGDVVVLPAEQPSLWGWDVESDVLHLRFDPRFLTEIAAETGDAT